MLLLLRQVRHADKSLSLSGEQVTILYPVHGRAPEQSEQSVLFDSTLGYRCVYNTPKRLAGQVIVSRADGFWHLIPERHLLIVGPPRPRRIGTQIGPLLRALKSGAAQASLLGSDTIAGRPVEVVLVSASSSAARPTKTAKLWIDTATGAQLRTEVYDAQGGLRSASYFTQIVYNPTFAPGAFDPPTAANGTRTVQQQRPVKLNRLPTDAEAGFNVLSPATLPPGYVFESASVFHYANDGGRAVTLRYRNGWGLLSLYERVTGNGTPQPARAASPRAGTVIVTRGSIELIAIGSFSNEELLNVLNSMR